VPIQSIFLKSNTDSNKFEIQVVTSKPDGLFNNPRPSFFFIGLIIVTGIIILTVSSEREKKRDKEIEKIESKKLGCDKCCEQYALVALINGWYPCFSPNCDGGRIC